MTFPEYYWATGRHNRDTSGMDQKSSMTPAKPEIHVSQLVETTETKFQRLHPYLHFWELDDTHEGVVRGERKSEIQDGDICISGHQRPSWISDFHSICTVRYMRQSLKRIVNQHMNRNYQVLENYLRIIVA
jgi:hypothetical protein